MNCKSYCIFAFLGLVCVFALQIFLEILFYLGSLVPGPIWIYLLIVVVTAVTFMILNMINYKWDDTSLEKLAGEWNLSVDDLRKSITKIPYSLRLFFSPDASFKDPHGVEILQKNIILFLVSKGICDLFVTFWLFLFGEEDRMRLLVLLDSEGDINTPFELAVGVQSLDGKEGFTSSCPIWKTSGFTFFGINTNSSIKYVNILSRVQKSGICYIHAVVVMISYLIQIKTQKLSDSMENISKYIRRSFSAVELKSHIFGNAGGNSYLLFQKMVGLRLFEIDISKITLEVLGDVGPILVSHFKVTKEFMSCKRWSFLSNYVLDWIDLGELHCHHAMMIVGIRLDDVFGQVFLLQNWWKEAQFVEVSAKYLSDCLQEGHLYALSPEVKDVAVKDTCTTEFAYSETACVGPYEKLCVDS